MSGLTEGSSPNTSFTSRVDSSAECFVCKGMISVLFGQTRSAVEVDSLRSSRLRRNGGGERSVLGGATEEG